MISVKQNENFFSIKIKMPAGYFSVTSNQKQQQRQAIAKLTA